jgi:hypothetical protein
LKIRFARVFAVILISCGSASALPIIYLADSAGLLANVDPTNGAATIIGNMPVVMADIAFASSGSLYGISFGGTSALYSINPMTAAATRIGINTGVFVNALTFASNGTLYGAGNSRIYTIDVSTGLATQIGLGNTLGTFTSAGDLAFDNAQNLYLTATPSAGTNSVLLQIDRANGIGTQVGITNTGFQQVYGLDWATGTMYGFTNVTREVISVNLSSGVGTHVANLSASLNGVYGVSTAVPEADTFFLAGIGLAIAWTWKRLAA